MNESKINFDNLNQSAPKKKKEKKKKKSTVEPSTRKIPLRKRRFQNGLTVFFYTLFIVMGITILMVIGRYNNVISLANKKEVSETEILQKVEGGQTNADFVSFQGKQWLEQLFTTPTNDKEKEERTKLLENALASDLSLSTIDPVRGEAKTTVKKVESIGQTSDITKGKTIYRTLYDVTFQDQDQVKQVQVALNAIYVQRQMVVIQYPEFVNISSNQTTGNKVRGYENVFKIQGSDVSSEEKNKIESFVKRFLTLYCKNDANLNLISAVSGLDGGQFQSATLTNVVTKKDRIYVQGTFSFSYSGDAVFTSKLVLEMRKNKDSYFVEKMNEKRVQ
ncbi:conjugal transfer protein [Listeria kieliensis]